MSPQDAGNRNASAPDVREAAEAVIRDFDRWRECEGPSNESAVAWRKFAESLDPLRAALAAPVSPPAASRDAVAEVLLHEAHPDLAPWSLLQLSGPNAAGIVVAVALARRQADAVMALFHKEAM